METLIIFYSLTGNNATFAKAIAQKLKADCIELKESRKRNGLTIFLDVILNRTPDIQPIERDITQYEHLIFVAPVWFGKIGTPLRSVFQSIKETDKEISFVSLSAGADGTNPGLESELKKRTATTPKAIVNVLISDLLPANPKPSRKLLDDYKITDTEAEMLADNILEKL